MAAAVELRGVHVKYPNGFHALRDVSCVVEPGQIVAMLGASGSGKSTVLRAIAGLEPLCAGDTWIDGVCVERAGELRVPTHKRGVGMVFQDAQLFPHMDVSANIAYGLHMQKIKTGNERARVLELLELVDLPTSFASRRVDTLSGGQAQRVALARSLAPSPKILLLDEPLSALDADLRESLSVQLREILKAIGTAAVYVTHDLEEAERVSDRIVKIADGLIQH